MKNDDHGFAPLLIIGIIAAVFVVAAGTAVASNSSKPGDLLYSIDRGTEKIQLALALTNGSKKDVHASLAAERLDEIEALMAEDEIDVSAINDATDDFDEHKSAFDDLSDDDGTLDEHEQELENELETKKSNIDKLAEDEQQALENQREDLKKEYEKAVEAGDSETAATLKTEISTFEDELNELEVNREAEKQSAEDDSEDQEDTPDSEDQVDQEDKPDDN